jgi:NAD(P)-dependent dehydrogenase (short-subunit alcohol dehydrogenase family)
MTRTGFAKASITGNKPPDTDFESVAAFLADPSISFHTGDTIVVDGGYTIF